MNAQRSPASTELQCAIAPTGVLRASINLGNPILARRNADARVVGVSVDLARGLADQLGLPLALVVFDTAARSVDAVKTGLADIGFFAIDPLRRDGVCFSAPYLLIEGAYLVRNESPLTDNAQVDRPGTRVMVGQGSAYDLHLTRHLKAATILRAPSSPAVVDRFLANEADESDAADVAAGVKQHLQTEATRLPGLRLLPGRFMVIQQAMGVQAGRGDRVEATLRRYVEQAKAGGMVADALARHGVGGAAVAPAG